MDESVPGTIGWLREGRDATALATNFVCSLYFVVNPTAGFGKIPSGLRLVTFVAYGVFSTGTYVGIFVAQMVREAEMNSSQH